MRFCLFLENKFPLPRSLHRRVKSKLSDYGALHCVIRSEGLTSFGILNLGSSFHPHPPFSRGVLANEGAWSESEQIALMALS